MSFDVENLRLKIHRLVVRHFASRAMIDKVNQSFVSTILMYAEFSVGCEWRVDFKVNFCLSEFFVNFFPFLFKVQSKFEWQTQAAMHEMKIWDKIVFRRFGAEIDDLMTRFGGFMAMRRKSTSIICHPLNWKFCLALAIWKLFKCILSKIKLFGAFYERCRSEWVHGECHRWGMKWITLGYFFSNLGEYTKISVKKL